MKFLIYTLNSFGGNYEYALELQKAYLMSRDVDDCKLVLPRNSPIHPGETVLKVLKADISPYKNKILKKLYFFYRSLANPLILLKVIRTHPGYNVIYNDFDQLTAFFWQPLFKIFQGKHVNAVILHDPDRDAYLPSEWLSRHTMASVMNNMQIAFYHGLLPDKTYYSGNILKVKVSHGVYSSAVADTELYDHILKEKQGFFLIGIIGNIRDEKNYELLINALLDLPTCKLLVAGQAASSAVNTGAYLNQIDILGVTDRVIWIQKYLSDAEMSATIQACDLISLYYKPSFTSQSGILNSIAPYRKNVIISETASAMTQTAIQYNIGKVVLPDNLPLFVTSVKQIMNEGFRSDTNSWARYLQENAWEQHVLNALEAFKSINIRFNAS